MELKLARSTIIRCAIAALLAPASVAQPQHIAPQRGAFAQFTVTGGASASDGTEAVAGVQRSVLGARSSSE